MPNESPNPAYFIALIQVPDIDSYRRGYGREVVAQVTAAGGKLLVASASPTILEGEWQSSWTVVIQFPDRDTAMRWYESREYAPLKKLRIEELTTAGTVALFDGFRPAATGS